MSPIDPNMQAMANKMQAARGGAPMQRPPMAAPAEQEVPAEGQVLTEVKMLLTKALQLLGGAEGGA